jgi:hypothetical protein
VGARENAPKNARAEPCGQEASGKTARNHPAEWQSHVARLRPGVDIDRARAEMRALATAQELANPATHTRDRVATTARERSDRGYVDDARASGIQS